MAIAAFVLINVTGDHTKSAYKTITRISGVKAIYAVTGVYDIIALVEAEDINTLSDLIVSKIRAIDGVTQTMTCVSLNV
ncbi:MAG: Lrp/AsnC ligand binding domain-containing protein [Nitrospira sp.]|nr:Lrp/AsnC ligand binding domain-containing protein [Nitrospira sp.]